MKIVMRKNGIKDCEFVWLDGQGMRLLTSIFFKPGPVGFGCISEVQIGIILIDTRPDGVVSLTYDPDNKQWGVLGFFGNYEEAEGHVRKILDLVDVLPEESIIGGIAFEDFLSMVGKSCYMGVPDDKIN